MKNELSNIWIFEFRGPVSPKRITKSTQTEIFYGKNEFGDYYHLKEGQKIKHGLKQNEISMEE